MIRIQKAEQNHIETITGFQLQMAMETENLKLDEDILRSGVTAVFRNQELGSYYIACNNDEIIASLLVTCEWSDWRNGQVLWIQSVFVKPEYRGQGIYRKMYEHLRQIVMNNDNLKGLRLYVDATNINAMKTYEKTGMNGEHYRLYEWMK